MKILWRSILGVIALLPMNSAMAMNESRLAETLYQAHKKGEKIPLVSEAQGELSVERAYVIQKHYVKRRLRKEKIAGFKAGLTSTSGQRTFKVSQPVMGVLFKNGLHTQGEPIAVQNFNRLMLETEIGYKLSKTITEPVADISTLKMHIESILPIIEMPDLGFKGKRGPQGVDVIAANVAARKFITGEAINDFTQIDLNTLNISLKKDGAEIYKGLGKDAMNDQWQAALWLVNMAIEQGWTLEPGHIIITGALGRMAVGKPGDYIADFDKLGSIQFSINP
ncbi:MAG: fumarylacetoacetate hydrolase family protein [Pseudomonadota bacterium]